MVSTVGCQSPQQAREAYPSGTNEGGAQPTQRIPPSVELRAYIDVDWQDCSLRIPEDY
jgi:hypothetical protein